MPELLTLSVQERHRLFRSREKGDHEVKLLMQAIRRWQNRGYAKVYRANQRLNDASARRGTTYVDMWYPGEDQ